MPLPLLAACLEQVAAKLRHVQTTGHELPPIRVRSGKGQTRTRTLFIRDLSDWIHDLTDLWMDEQVAALAALKLGGNIDADVVRNARRPTTRKARKS
jgi:hypothetical protein